jgi:DmsE family decaheme c-type cytochrome
MTAMLAVLRHVALAATLVWAGSALAQPAVPICANCHAVQHTSIAMGPHGVKNDPTGSMCQACHGDASAHAKDPMKVKPENKLGKNVPPVEKSAVCLTCHSGNRNLAFWTSGKHAINDVDCASCHAIHGRDVKPNVSPFVTTQLPNQADMCGTCHQPIRTAILKPSHHPIIEGKVKCSDCHNPHGALSHAMVKQPTVNDQCYSCHTDKRGPYIWNHPPVEENCLTCHDPHGSSHYKLTKEHTPNLCQDCHDWSRHPGTIYGAAGGFVCAPGDTAAACANNPGAPNPAVSTRLIARACLNCHNAVHGSNAPANRGKFFIR